MGTNDIDVAFNGKRKVATLSDIRQQMLGMRGDRAGIEALLKKAEDNELGLNAKDTKQVKDWCNVWLAEMEKEKKVEVGEVKEYIGDEIRGQRLMAVGKEIDGVNVVGYMVGYTVGACAIPNDVVQQFWASNTMPKGVMPRVARPKPAFQRAVQEQKRTEQVDGKFCVWDVREVDKKGGEEYVITRIVYISDKEKGKRDLEHVNVANVMFYQNTENGGVVIEAKPTSERFKGIAANIQEEVRKQYDIFMQNVVDKQVRDAMRNFVRGANGIPFTMGNGGSWFIPIRAESTLRGWRSFAKVINEKYLQNVNPVVLRAIPLVDNYEVKQMIEEDVATEVRQRLDNLLETTMKALQDATASGKEQAEIEKAIEKVLLKKLEEHNKSIGLLETYKELLGKKVEVALDDMKERLEKVEIPLGERHQLLLRKLASLDKA